MDPADHQRLNARKREAFVTGAPVRLRPAPQTRAVRMPEELLLDSALAAEAILAGCERAAEAGDGPAPDHVVGTSVECCERCGALTEAEWFAGTRVEGWVCSDCWSDTATEE